MTKTITFISILLLGAFSTNAQSLVPEKNNPKTIIQPKAAIQAYAFNLKDVKLLDGSPFKKAQDLDAAYLLTIEPNRLLHRFHANAGLPTKGEVYGGWESEGLSGHTLGHYLSACSLMYVSTGNPDFKNRVDYITDELERCQQARKTGYVGAIPKEDTIFGDLAKGIIKSSGFDLNGGWSPFYTVHKIMAGLLDAYLYTDNSKALKIASGIADWTENTFRNLTNEQIQKALTCEYGGMNDVLANLYALTGQKKYLDLSHTFHDQAVLGKLANQIDPMPGRHSNTNVPKAIGCANRYELTNDATDKTIAQFFWKTMTEDHSYVIGGNSNYEYCGPAKQLNDRLSDNTCETCNTYNMLKLTRHLFCWSPNRHLADYYERALYNHILASQNPETGMMCYFVPLRMGAKKQFSDAFNTFTCCVGSGMENHTKYAESIYYEGADGSLYLNLFIPSELDLKSKGMIVRQETKFPESPSTQLTISTPKKTSMILHIRNPIWANDQIAITLNDQPIAYTKDTTGYLTIHRKWKNNDRLNITFGMNLHTEAMPDNPNRIAFLYGPIVLAGQLGKTMPDPIFGTPVLLTDNRNIQQWIKPNPNQPLAFQMAGVGKPNDVPLIPFYQTASDYYSVYWDYFTNADWLARQGEYEAEKKRAQAIEDKTIDVMRFEMQPERDHHLQTSEKSYAEDAYGRMGREVRSGGFFSFDMKVNPETPNALLCSYIGDDKDRTFGLQIDGKTIATQELKGGKTGRFYDEVYPIPAEYLKGKNIITVQVQALPNKTAGRVFGCRIIKD